MAQEKIIEQMFKTLGMKGLKEIFGSNAVDRGINDIIELMLEKGENFDEIFKYLRKGFTIEKKYLGKVPIKKVTYKFEK